MKKFEAKCLDEVYELAKADFNCSITDLDIEVIQQPSNGFLGFGKKNAVIQACFKDDCQTYEKEENNQSFKKKDIKIEELSSKLEASYQNDVELKKDENKESLSSVPSDNSKEKMFDNFYTEKDDTPEVKNIVIKKQKDEVLDEIRSGIFSLFNDTCYDINDIKVEYYDETTVYVEFSGEDSALLIGKEGYRYKALSYILFNWINEKFGLMLRLEVAEFLKNQELAIYAYLEPVIEIIKEKGTFKTKPLDGILVHIALKKLREEFPNKYVAVKTNVRGDKYVLVNEYRSKEQ